MTTTNQEISAARKILEGTAPAAIQPAGELTKDQTRQIYAEWQHAQETPHGLYMRFQRAAKDGAASPPAFDFHGHLARQAAWSATTFGPGARTAGLCDHIRKELLEIEADPLDLKEWIDVVILGLDGAWRCGGKPGEIIDAIAAKQAKNEGRNWPDWRTMDPNKAIEHDRSGEVLATSSAAKGEGA